MRPQSANQDHMVMTIRLCSWPSGCAHGHQVVTCTRSALKWPWLVLEEQILAFIAWLLLPCRGSISGIVGSFMSVFCYRSMTCMISMIRKVGMWISVYLFPWQVKSMEICSISGILTHPWVLYLGERVLLEYACFSCVYVEIWKFVFARGDGVYGWWLAVPAQVNGNDYVSLYIIPTTWM